MVYPNLFSRVVVQLLSEIMIVFKSPFVSHFVREMIMAHAVTQFSLCARYVWVWIWSKSDSDNYESGSLGEMTNQMCVYYHFASTFRDSCIII